MSEARDIPLSDIEPNPRNPRKVFDEGKLDELAESIQKQGLLQPVLVRPVEGGYELVHGERRYRAVKKTEGDSIRAEVRDLTDREALEISVTENLQREDVSPLAEAESYRSLIDEFDLTQEEVADRVGKSRSHIANCLKLLDLPERLQQDVLHKTLSPWQARELNRVWGDYYLRDLAIDHELTVKELRTAINDLQNDAEQIRITRTAPVEAFTDELQKDPPWERYSFQNQRPVSFRWWAEEAEQARVWANENIDGFDHPLNHDDEVELRPLAYSWVSRRLLFGWQRVKYAKEWGYDGDLQVEIIFPSALFDWSQRIGECGG